MHESRKLMRLPPAWVEVSRAHLDRHPECFACRGREHLHVHHIDRDPVRALDTTNLITLCMGERECHLLLGHGGDWKRHNPIVFAIAGGARHAGAAYFKNFVKQARRESIED